MAGKMELPSVSKKRGRNSKGKTREEIIADAKGNEVAVIKDFIAQWGKELDHNNSLGIHNIISQDEIVVVIELLKSITPSKEELYDIQATIDGFENNLNDRITQLSRMQKQVEIDFLQDLSNQLAGEMQNLRERANIQETEMPSEGEEQQEDSILEEDTELEVEETDDAKQGRKTNTFRAINVRRNSSPEDTALISIWFLEEINQEILNGILTEEEIESLVFDENGKQSDSSYDLFDLFRKKKYENCDTNRAREDRLKIKFIGRTNEEIIKERLKKAGKTEGLTDKQIETEFKKVCFYITANKNESGKSRLAFRLHNATFDECLEIIDEAVEHYQEYIDEVLRRKGIEADVPETEPIDESTEPQVGSDEPQFENIDDPSEPQAEIVEEDPIIASINKSRREREDSIEIGQRLEELSEQLEGELSEIQEELATQKAKREETKANAQSRREAKASEIEERRQELLRRLQELDEEEQGAMDIINQEEADEISGIEAEMRALSDELGTIKAQRAVASEGIDEARRRQEEIEAKLRAITKLLGIDTDNEGR